MLRISAPLVKQSKASELKTSLFENNYQKQITDYIALGDEYAVTAASTHFVKWQDIIYASALWNCALNLAMEYKPPLAQELIPSRLKDLKSRFIASVNGKESKESSLSLLPHSYWQSVLKKIRFSIKTERDATSITNVRFLYEKISHDMRLFLSDLIKEASEQIEPCLSEQDFCVIGSGSFATHGTSFSDIEFAILVKDESIIPRIYAIVTLLFYNTLNLMETPLRALNIEELDFLYNDFNHSMKAGFRFDGGKSRLYPLLITDVCSTVGPFSLVQTPQNMLKLMQQHLNCQDHMVTYNFLHPNFLMGSQHLFIQYRELVEEHFFKQTIENSSFLLHGYFTQMIGNDLVKYSPKLQELYIFKHEIYGILNVFKTLKMLLNLHSNDHWEQLAELYQNNMISFEMYTQFTKFINWIQYHRIQLYTVNDGQHDRMPVILDHQIVSKYEKKPHIHYFLSDIYGLIFTFYSTALQLNQFVHFLLENRSQKIEIPLTYPFHTIIPFLENYLSRDNTSLSKIQSHQLYSKMGDLFLANEAFQFIHDAHLTILSIRVLSCIANCQMLSHKPEAVYPLSVLCEKFLQHLLNQAQKEMYDDWLCLSLDAPNHNEKSQEIASMLAKIDLRLPTLAAAILYLESRCFFFKIPHVNRPQSYDFIRKACALRDWIDHHIQQCNETWNEHGADSYIFARSSLLMHLLDNAATDLDCLNVAEKYKALLHINDHIHQMECHHRLTKIYIKAFKLNSQQRYYQQALSHFKELEQLSSTMESFSFKEKYKSTKAELIKLNHPKTSSSAFFSQHSVHIECNEPIFLQNPSSTRT